jgi:hypothetical protein
VYDDLLIGDLVEVLGALAGPDWTKLTPKLAQRFDLAGRAALLDGLAPPRGPPPQRPLAESVAPFKAEAAAAPPRPPTPKALSLIAASDVLVYVGDLADFLAAAQAALAPGGLVAFTTERLPDRAGRPATEDERSSQRRPGAAAGPDTAAGVGWKLQPSGRFAHEPAYVRRLAGELGFDVIVSDEIVPRFEMGKPIDGQLFVLRSDLGQHPAPNMA